MTGVNSELDDLLSDAPAADDVTTEPTTPAATPDATTTQPRDETGKFAAKGQEPPVANTPDPVTDGTQPPATADKPNNGVPVKAVQEERQKRQDAEASAEALRRELAEMRGQMQALMSQRQQPAQQQEEKQPASLWDDPDAYLKDQLTPVQKQMMEMREFVSENLAVQAYGAETVEAAKKAIEQAAHTPEGQQTVQKLMQSRHPFDDLVKWHKQQETMTRVGSDPEAWLNAELEKKMDDPAFQAQFIERIRGAAANPNNPGTAVNLPPSLSGLPAGGNASADNDVSDAALFSHALR